MLRTIFILSALVAWLFSFGAMAAPSRDEAPAARASTGAILLAQEGNVDVYYDARGNRVIVDADTGKVIAIQPPQTRFDRRALRRDLRARELDRGPANDDRYYLDDPQDMARLRRRQMQEDGRVIVPQDDGYDPYGDNSVDAYPPAPRNDGYANSYPDAPRQPSAQPEVKRQPLKEASIDPAQPS